MHSASIFSETKKVTRTQLVEIFRNTKETVFTCTFHTKVDDKHIKEVLSLSKEKDLSKLAKEITTGKEIQIVGFLTRSKWKLGRSSVIDLNE